MSNIIEELAKQYAKYQTDWQGYDSTEEWEQDVAIYYDDAKEVLSWLFTKPLASRLTTEEKERVKRIYNAEKEHVQFQMKQANASMNQMCRSWHNQLKEGSYAKLRLLESIFGSDFFKEEE